MRVVPNRMSSALLTIHCRQDVAGTVRDPQTAPSMAKG